MECTFKKYTLHFKKPGGTSRGILYNKDTYFLILREGERTAYGECNCFKNLSYDDREGFEIKLAEMCQRLPAEREQVLDELQEWPSIHFGIETVLRDFKYGSKQLIFPQSIAEAGFTIPVNGLIWMGPEEEMKAQIIKKLKAGYTSIKLKIGAIDFERELELLRYIRQQFSEKEVEIRVDANGAFAVSEAAEKLEQIAQYEISYIEQPVKAGQWQEMAALAEESPIPIALDEELIGIRDSEAKKKLMATINPQLLVLKPALVGGFGACDEWKNLIEVKGGSWVMTSALESNIGLNAIAQYTATGYSGFSGFAQGMGTGQLFTNNFPSPYTVDAKGLHYHKDKNWDFSLLS